MADFLQASPPRLLAGLTALVLAVMPADKASPDEPTVAVAQPDHRLPPYASDLFATPRAGHGGFQRFLFWRHDPDRNSESFVQRAQRRSQHMVAQGLTPTLSLMHWSPAYAHASPASDHPDTQSPAHRAWFEWMHLRKDAFWVNRHDEHPGANRAPDGSGLATAFGWIPPQRLLNAKDPDRDNVNKILTYGQWFNQHLADYAGRVGINGVSLADHFDQLPHHDVTEVDFQPAVVAAFAEQAGLSLPAESVKANAAYILDRHFPAWIDHWNHAYADWYGDMARRLQAATGRPAVIQMQKHTHIHDKRYHAIDARLIHAGLPAEAKLAYQVEAWSAPWNRGLGGGSLSAYMAMVGTHLCREPAMTRGVMMPMADTGDAPEPGGRTRAMSVWRTTMRYAGNHDHQLTRSSHHRLGERVLDAAWITLPLVHLATRDGHVERAAMYMQRQFKHTYPQKLWEDVVRPIVPTRPYGPALYYPVSLERDAEKRREKYNPIVPLESVVGGTLTPAYYVSDVALDALRPEAVPTAWIVAGVDRLPRHERQALKQHAPIFDVSDLARAPSPVKFGPGATGFAFIDQHDRIVIVAMTTDLLNDRPSDVTVRFQGQPDGRYKLTDLREPEHAYALTITQGRGHVRVPMLSHAARIFVVDLPHPPSADRRSR